MRPLATTATKVVIGIDQVLSAQFYNKLLSKHS